MAATLVFMPAKAASAYAGPGAKIAAVGIFPARFTAVWPTILGLYWYPLRRIRIKLQGGASARSAVEPESK